MYVTIPGDQSPIAFHARLPKTKTRTTRSVETIFKSGSYLFYEGDPVKSLYEVKTGILRQTRLLEDGRRQVIAFGYPGDIVGFPVDGLHHTDCDVLTDARVQLYNNEALECGARDPALHNELVQAALREIGAMQDHFMMLGRKSAAEKVASFLWVLSERVGENQGQCRLVSLPMNRADIADFLGLTTETVSRSLSQLRRNKVIAIEGIHNVTILRPKALLGLSEGQESMIA